MKGNRGVILLENQERYLESLVPPRDPVAAAMEDHANQANVPIVDPEVGRFLYIAARAHGTRRALEIGTATGYSGLWIARALPPDGRLVTIDVDPERQRMARESWVAAGVAERIETRLGPALDVLPTLSGPFDLLFLDALKEEYAQYLALALPLLRPGALVIADNVLWKGLVAGGAEDEETAALRAFNHDVVNDPRFTATVIAVGDGLLYGIVAPA